MFCICHRINWISNYVCWEDSLVNFEIPFYAVNHQHQPHHRQHPQTRISLAAIHSFSNVEKGREQRTEREQFEFQAALQRKKNTHITCKYKWCMCVSVFLVSPLMLHCNYSILLKFQPNCKWERFLFLLPAEHSGAIYIYMYTYTHHTYKIV